MSRPVERIEPMIAALRNAWNANPDQRLGQLIGNAARAPNTDNGYGYGDYRDPFNVEDDELWAGLSNLVKDPPA